MGFKGLTLNTPPEVRQRKCRLISVIIFFFEFRLRDIPLFDRIYWFLKLHYSLTPSVFLIHNLPEQLFSFDKRI